jgi:hypothetical protein
VIFARSSAANPTDRFYPIGARMIEVAMGLPRKREKNEPGFFFET